MTEPKFDVAISFLARDEHLALELGDRLATELDTFVYSKQQEQLAGSEGLESLREAFRDASRLVVVLYRDEWGNTPWTGVEQTAIKDRALAEGWEFLLFLALDKVSVVPKWLPETRIRLSLPDYGIDQAIGAIKTRVEQLGGVFRKRDAISLAKQAADRAAKRQDADRILASSGYAAAQEECRTLFAEVARLSTQIAEEAPALNLRGGSGEDRAVLTTIKASMAIWGYLTHPPRESKVTARLFFGRVLLPQEQGLRLIHEAEEHGDLVFTFDYRPGVGWCWISGRECRSTTDLADYLVSKFVYFAEQVDRGQLVGSERD